MANKLLTVDEVAETLAIQPATIRRWLLLRKIPYCKIGRSVRIESDTVQSLIQQGRIPARPSASL